MKRILTTLLLCTLGLPALAFVTVLNVDDATWRIANAAAEEVRLSV